MLGWFFSAIGNGIPFIIGCIFRALAGNLPLTGKVRTADRNLTKR